MIPAPGAFAVGLVLIFIVIWDAFESIILPWRVTRQFRLTRLFFRITWSIWKFTTNLVSSHKSREALTELHKALQTSPREFSALLFSGLAYIELTEYDRAQAVLEKARQVNDSDPLLYWALGSLAMMHNDARAAVPQLERCVAVAPDNPRCVWLLGTAYAILAYHEHARPVAQAEYAARAESAGQGAAGQVPPPRVICLSAAGQPLTDARVKQLAQEGSARDSAPGRGVILVCGRYEGIDQRFVDAFVDEEVSIGDFVLSGGEIAAMCLIDAVVRHLPGALKEASVQDESFGEGRLDAPQYTRPESWRGRSVPPVLMSGDHARIEQWRRSRSLERTRCTRPDLLQGKALAS